MFRPGHILVVTDPHRPGAPALERARLLAERTGASLRLLCVDYSKPLVRARFLDREQLERAILAYCGRLQKRLDQLAAGLRKTGIEVETEAVWDKDAAGRILELARRDGAGLILKDAEPAGLLRRLLVTSLDWRLLREAPMPVWLAGDFPGSEAQAVLAALDPVHSHGKPEALDRAILEAAQGIAQWWGGEYHVVHVMPHQAIVGDIAAEGPFMQTDFLDRLRDDHRRVFERFCAEHAVPEAARHFIEGEPGTAVTAVAEQLKAGLLVMGASYERRGMRALLGTTAERILAQAPCDVLVLRAE